MVLDIIEEVLDLKSKTLLVRWRTETSYAHALARPPVCEAVYSSEEAGHA